MTRDARLHDTETPNDDPSSIGQWLLENIRTTLSDMPELSRWPEVRRLIDRPVRPGSRPTWNYPATACAAVGAPPKAVLPAAVAVFCSLYSIHLVDDMLDDDPGGLFHELGTGTVANLALALQGAAGKALAAPGVSPERQAWMQEGLGQMTMATALGQDLDAKDPEGEDGYWRVVRLKTPPLFSFALYCGAVLGGADRDLAEAVGGFGNELGDIVQVNDDLHDAMERPAAADWGREWTNLPILYARSADHGDRNEFLDLMQGNLDAPGALERAQEILVSSGAVSYCAYRIIGAYRSAKERLSALDLVNPAAIEELLDHHIRPLERLFAALGVEEPERLFAE
ncbi:MAG: polyprenyl synthetase family protein [Acidobacteriota bacterium]